MSNDQNATGDNDNDYILTSSDACDVSQEIPYTSYQTAGYISYLLDDLRMLAEQSKMPFLAYLLNMAFEEAESQKHRKF